MVLTNWCIKGWRNRISWAINVQAQSRGRLQMPYWRSKNSQKNPLVATRDVRVHMKLNKYICCKSICSIPRRVRVCIAHQRNDDEDAKEALRAKGPRHQGC